MINDFNVHFFKDKSFHVFSMLISAKEHVGNFLMLLSISLSNKRCIVGLCPIIKIEDNASSRFWIKFVKFYSLPRGKPAFYGHGRKAGKQGF